MSSLMYAQMGLSVVNGLSNFAASREQNKLNESIRKYRNTVAMLSAAQSENTITLNEIQSRDVSVAQGLDIQRQEIIASGQARVASGSAGVAGGSVQQVMQGIRSSASRAQYARQETTRRQMQAFGNERTTVRVNAALGQDTTVVPKPSTASTLLGLGTNILQIYDQHQTPGDTIAARLSS